MKIGEYELRDGKTVWRKLGYTKSDISIPICKIYGDTSVIRERIFIRLFTPSIEYNSKYTPLAHGSVVPIVDRILNRPAGEIGYDVKGGVSESKYWCDCDEDRTKCSCEDDW